MFEINVYFSIHSGFLIFGILCHVDMPKAWNLCAFARAEWRDS